MCLFRFNMIKNNYIQIFLSKIRTVPISRICNKNKWEGVGTSNFRTTTGHFFQNVEIVFLVYHHYDITTSKMAFELITTTTIRTSKRTQKLTFNALILPMASKKITTSKIKISTTNGILPMVTKACGGLGQGQLGQVRLGYIELGQIRLG